MASSKPAGGNGRTGRLLREFLLGVLRLGAVLAVYAAASLAGAVIAGVTATGSVPTLVACLLGFLVPPVVLTLGFIAWLLPATVRIYARGGDPDSEFAVPSPADGVLLVGVATVLSGLAADTLGVSMQGFVVLAVAASTTIIAVGGRKVAEIWSSLVLQLLAG